MGLGIGSILGGQQKRKAAKSAAKSRQRAAEAGIAEQREAREFFKERTDPFRDVGLVGAEQLTSFLEDPTQQLAEINPIVDILREQGFTDIQETAAAQGRLGAGGTLQDLTQFNTDLAATIVPQLQNQRFNQLFNVAGLGANVSSGQGTATLNTAGNIANLLGNRGEAKAGGAIGKANAITETISNLTQLAGLATGGAGGGFNALGSGGVF